MTERERRRLRWGAIASSILAIYLMYVIVFALTSGKHYTNLGEKLTIRGLFALVTCVSAIRFYRKLAADRRA
jgi:cation transport ATPase